VGTIYACYACQNTGNAAIDAALTANPSVASDGLLFAFVNTSGSAITGGVFTVKGTLPNDSFALPTIAAGGTFILIPGITSDGSLGHLTGSIFAATGSTMDTSDGDGSVNDTTVWSFTGLDNGLSATTGNFTAGQANLILPFRDNPANGSTSFLGDGPSGDGGCNNCYFGPIAAINTPTVTAVAPEPGACGLALTGAGMLAFFLRRRMA
jgi:hypothetical protein